MDLICLTHPYLLGYGRSVASEISTIRYQYEKSFSNYVLKTMKLQLNSHMRLYNRTFDC